MMTSTDRVAAYRAGTVIFGASSPLELKLAERLAHLELNAECRADVVRA